MDLQTLVRSPIHDIIVFLLLYLIVSFHFDIRVGRNRFWKNGNNKKKEDTD